MRAVRCGCTELHGAVRIYTGLSGAELGCTNSASTSYKYNKSSLAMPESHEHTDKTQSLDKQYNDTVTTLSKVPCF